jgi:hypothetical protein
MKMTKTKLVEKTVAHAWTVLNQFQFDKHCLGDFCPNMGKWEEQLDKLFAKAQKLEAKAEKAKKDSDRKKTYDTVAKEKAKWGL